MSYEKEINLFLPLFGQIINPSKTHQDVALSFYLLLSLLHTLCLNLNHSELWPTYICVNKVDFIPIFSEMYHFLRFCGQTINPSQTEQDVALSFSLLLSLPFTLCLTFKLLKKKLIRS